jgi:hypothetical protein
MIGWHSLVSALLVGQFFLPITAMAATEQEPIPVPMAEKPAEARPGEDREMIELLELLEIMDMLRDLEVLANLEEEKKQ